MAPPTCGPPNLFVSPNLACSWAAATGKLTNHTVETPKGLRNVEGMSFFDVAPVPGRNQAFAYGLVATENGTYPAISYCIWYWNGTGGTWKATWKAGCRLGSCSILL